METFAIKTYTCPECGYKQDFSPDDGEQMALHHPGVPVGYCPSCHGNNAERTVNRVEMVRETREDELTRVTGNKDDYLELVEDGSYDA